MDIYDKKFAEADEAEAAAEAAELGQLLLDPDDVDEEKEEKSKGFSGKIAQDLYGLLYLGRIEEEFELYGHLFRMRTLTVGEELTAHEAVAHLRDSTGLAQSRGYATAMVAASIHAVDGKPLAKPLGPNDNLIKKKIAAVNEWFWPVIEELYGQYVQLERRQFEALEELKKGRKPMETQ